VRFFADESVDQPIVKSLRDKDYLVDYVTELSPGISDNEVLALAKEKDAILITGDKDFGNLIFRLGKSSAGIILYRLSGLSNNAKAALVLKVVEDYSEELAESFTIISIDQIRIKKLPQ
jgi:predicted nuclease of predicted toxin-antitoxin system